MVEGKRMQEDIPWKRKHAKVGLVILVSEKMELKTRILLEIYKNTFDSDKWVNSLKHITIFNEYISNNRVSKYME